MYDIFISYSSNNNKQAELIKQEFEKNGFSCWYAPVNIHGNRDFTNEIPNAIKNSKAFVLLMSEDAQNSKWVQRELGTADEYNIPIYTLVLDNCLFNERFQFVLRFNQHYSYAKEGNKAIERMISEIKEEMGKGNNNNLKNSSEKMKPKKAPTIIIAVVLAVLITIGGSLFFLFSNDPDNKEYVIWCPSYDIALTSNTAKNSHYLDGEKISVTDNKPSGFTDYCKWNITYISENKITISCDNVNLGVKPRYSGVGLGGNFTADEWEIIKVDGGYVKLRNTKTKSYLQWYDKEDNWSCYGKITNDNKTQFLLKLDKVS